MVAMNLCPTCRKMLYRTDACKGVGVECGRADGGARNVAGGTLITLAQPKEPLPVTYVNGKLLKKSTAALMEVQAVGANPVVAEMLTSKGAGSIPVAAGTQAPPVDTHRKRGRPSTGFDKKAYDREQSRKRRAKLKEGK